MGGQGLQGPQHTQHSPSRAEPIHRFVCGVCGVGVGVGVGSLSGPSRRLFASLRCCLVCGFLVLIMCDGHLTCLWWSGRSTARCRWNFLISLTF